MTDKPMTDKPMTAREALSHIEAEDYDDKDIDALTRLVDAAAQLGWRDMEIDRLRNADPLTLLKMARSRLHDQRDACGPDQHADECIAMAGIDHAIAALENTDAD